MIYENIAIDCLAPKEYIFASQGMKPAKILAAVNDITQGFDPIVDFGKGHWVHFSTAVGGRSSAEVEKGLQERHKRMTDQRMNTDEIEIGGKMVSAIEAYNQIKAKYESSER